MNGLFLLFLFGVLGAKDGSILTIENNDANEGGGIFSTNISQDTGQVHYL